MKTLFSIIRENRFEFFGLVLIGLILMALTKVQTPCERYAESLDLPLDTECVILQAK
jgi:hypothetical protein